MSNPLNSLVKLTSFQLDEMRRALKILQDQEDATNIAIQELKIELIREAENINKNTDINIAQSYGSFSTIVAKKIAGLEKFLDELTPQLENARDDLAMAFGEYKKMEISRDNQQTEVIKKNNHKEQLEMDELGMQGHRRNKNND